jgi:hypothetical protein
MTKPPIESKDISGRASVVLAICLANCNGKDLGKRLEMHVWHEHGKATVYYVVGGGIGTLDFNEALAAFNAFAVESHG